MDKLVQWKPLAMRVIAVAVEGNIKDWAAYIDAVPGENHLQEWSRVQRGGAKLPAKVAKALFPSFKHLHYRS